MYEATDEYSNGHNASHSIVHSSQRRSHSHAHCGLRHLDDTEAWVDAMPAEDGVAAAHNAHKRAVAYEGPPLGR